MTRIQGIEKVQQTIGSWNPSDLAVITRLELVSSEKLSNTKMRINALFQPRTDAWPNFEEEVFEVVIDFDGVGNLTLKEFGGGFVQIMGFDINFVGDRGMEGINFRIEDYEDDRIRFDCSGITIQSATRVPLEGS